MNALIAIQRWITSHRHSFFTEQYSGLMIRGYAVCVVVCYLPIRHEKILFLKSDYHA